LGGLGVLDIFVGFRRPCEVAVLLLCSDEELEMENMEEMRLAKGFSMV
jgi:hypothetical protein